MKKSLGIILVLVLVLSMSLVGCKDEVKQEEQVYEVGTDWDGDGLSNQDEIKIWHTNPFDPDSDGDGYNDYLEATSMYESTRNTFNPAIADLPDIKIEILSEPVITKVTEDTNGNTSSENVTCSDSSTIGSSITNTDAQTSSSESYWGVSVSVEHKWGTQAGTGVSVTGSGGHRWSSGDTVTFSKNNNESYSKSFAESISNSNSYSQVFKGGRISVTVRIVNDSDISYNVQNLSLIAYNIAPGYDGESAVIASLYMNPDSSDPSAVNTIINAHDKSTSLKFTSPLISVEGMRKLMVNSSGIYVALGTNKIAISDSNGSHDFTATTTNVGAKTALVAVDYGPTIETCTNEKYNISTKVVTLDDSGNMVFEGSRTLSDLLGTALGDSIVYEEDEDGYKMVRSVRGIEGSEYNPEMTGKWFIAHTKSVNGNDVRYFYSSVDDQRYNSDHVSVVAGDVIELIYSIDNDGDGIPLRSENMYGTSDENADSDGDNVSDYDEVSGWIPDGSTEPVYTNPNCSDTDGDDIPDGEDPYPLVSAGESSVDVRYLNFAYTPFGSSIATNSRVKVHDLTAEELIESEKEDMIHVVERGSENIICLNLDAGDINASSLVLTPVKRVQAIKVACWILTDLSEDGPDPYDFIKDGTGEGYYTSVPVNTDGSFTLQTTPVGEFKILLKVTSADEKNEEWYVVTANCPLQVPSNFKVYPNDADAAMSWSAVTDTRAQKILIVRTKTAFEGPYTDSSIASLIQALSNNNLYESDDCLFQVLGTNETQNTVTSGYGQGYIYYIYTYLYSGGDYIFSGCSYREVAPQVPDYFNVQLALTSLTVTNDHGDAGDGFELTWDGYYSIDGSTETNFESQDDEWKAECTATYTFGQGHGFVLNKNQIDSKSDHVITVRMFLTEHDTAFNGDDHKTLYFYIIYSKDAGKFYINYNKNSLDGAVELYQSSAGNLNLTKEIKSSGCVDGNMKFDIFIIGSDGN